MVHDAAFSAHPFVFRALGEQRHLRWFPGLAGDFHKGSKGLAPSIINNLIDALRQLKAQNTTILLVEQNFQMAKTLGDGVAVMDNGRIVHAGAMAQLAEDETLQHKLLGLSLGAHQ